MKVVDKIIEIVQEVTEIEDIKLKTRKTEYIQARQMAMSLIKNETGRNNRYIGEVLGYTKGSTTVYKGLVSFSNELRFNKFVKLNNAQCLKKLEAWKNSSL